MLNDNNKPWFTETCKQKRNEFNQAKKYYSIFKGENNRTTLKNAAKNYRHEVNVCYARYQKNEDDLRRISTTDTKTLWKILNKYSGRSAKTPDIDLNTFYEYFKKLNSDDSVESNENLNVSESFELNPICEAILNSEITVKEVLGGISLLKNNKASGYDKIVNEYLKASNDKLIQIYCKLFNVVFESSIVPESWLVGIIQPNLKNKGIRLIQITIEPSR